MSDQRLLSREFLSDFINVYRENPCLWKIKSKDYSDKHKKNAAYAILIEKLKEVDPATNKEAVIKRINSMRTCFRKELKKYKQSFHSGMDADEVSKPNLWYFDLLLFLSDQETPRQDGLDNIQDESTAHDVQLTEDMASDMVSEISTTPSTSSSKPSTSGIKRKSSKTPSSNSDRVLSIVAEKLQKEGRYSAFGKHVAQELEELPNEMAIYCKRIISEAIYEAQLGNLSRDSTIVTSNTLIGTQNQRQNYEYGGQLGGNTPASYTMLVKRSEAASAGTNNNSLTGQFFAGYNPN